MSGQAAPTLPLALPGSSLSNQEIPRQRNARERLPRKTEDAMTVTMNRIVLTMDVADWRDVPLSRDKRDLILRRLAKDVALKIDKDAACADIVVHTYWRLAE